MADVGYSGTPLAQKLGLKGEQRALFIDLPVSLAGLTITRSAIALAMLAAPAPSAAAEVMSVTESAFVELLVGCWSDQSDDVCFYPDGTVSSAVFHMGADGMLYGGVGGGTWSLLDEKLIVTSETDFWAFPLTSMVCDAVVHPKVSLQLSGCVDTELELAAQTPIAIELHSIDVTIADIRAESP